MIPKTAARAATSVLQGKHVNPVHVQMAVEPPIVTENPLTHLTIPPTADNAETSVVWEKYVNPAHVRRA